MNSKVNGAILLLMSITMMFSSCKKENVLPNNVTFPDVKTGEIAVFTRVGNPTGTSLSGWLQLTDKLTPSELTNKHAIQVPWSAPPAYLGNDIFLFPDFSPTGSQFLQKWTRSSNGSLTKTGEMILPDMSYGMSIAFASNTKAYLSTWLGKLIVFNPQTMQKTDEINLSSYAAEGIANPLFGGLFIHDNILYVPIIQVDGNYIPKTKPQVQVALVDIKDNKVQKVIYEKESGLSGGPYQYSEDTFVDEKGDIYMLASGNYGMNPEHKTGLLRIKKGETEFDANYKWVLNNQEIIGDPNKGIWLEVTAYAGNGKLYGLMDIPAYRKNPAMPDWYNDFSCMAVEIDIYAKTVKKLDIPLSMSIAPVVEKYKDVIVFGNKSKSDNGFYTYNPKTGETSKEAVIKLTGDAVGFHYFKP